MSLTIKTRLYLLAGLITLAMVFMALFQQYAMQEINDADLVRLQVTEIERDMLTLRRNEKDFLARNDLKYADQHQQNYETLQKRVAQLATMLKAMGHDAHRAQALRDELTRYRTHFQNMLRYQKTMGLNPKDGLYGTLREAVHNAEKEIKALKDDRLLADMLMLRRREKDFMLRSDLKYTKKFDNDMAIFLQHLAARDIPGSRKQHIRQQMERYKNDFHALVEASRKRGLGPKDGYMGEMRTAVHKTESELTQLVRETNGLIREHKQMLSNTVNGVSLLIILLTLGAILLIERPLSHRIKRLADIMRQAQERKDLSLRANLQGQDELAAMGRSFNQMMETFEGVVAQVAQAAKQVIDTSHNLSETTEQATRSVTHQQSMTEQVATAMHEMSASVQEVATHSAEAARMSQVANDEADRGRTVVNQTISGIQQLAQEVEETATVLNKLEKESENIGAVLTMIQNIAEQTNLLALNAAIEAARAGESGRGFAVVADEVRSLAQRSQESIQEIQAIIDRLQSGTQHAVKAMESGRNQAQARVEEVAAAGASLDAITRAVNTISDMNIQIASAVEEQSVTAGEISANVTDIAQIASKTVDASNQSTETGRDLAGLAAQLQQAMGQFHLAQ